MTEDYKTQILSDELDKKGRVILNQFDEIERLKQENETIREHCKQVDETNKILYQEKCELIQENEKLRKENREIKVFFDNAAKKNTNLENKMKEYGEQYDELYWISDQLLKDKTKYKTALEEIREMCNKHLDAKEICYATQVIDKIDEVLQ